MRTASSVSPSGCHLPQRGRLFGTTASGPRTARDAGLYILPFALCILHLYMVYIIYSVNICNHLFYTVIHILHRFFHRWKPKKLWKTRGQIRIYQKSPQLCTQLWRFLWFTEHQSRPTPAVDFRILIALNRRRVKFRFIGMLQRTNRRVGSCKLWCDCHGDRAQRGNARGTIIGFVTLRFATAPPTHLRDQGTTFEPAAHRS